MGINGKSVEFLVLKKFFMKMKLNVSNPHFLIMQGKITQIVKGKPIDLCKLVEEATGILIYERKKKSALKNLSKKEKKIIEICELLDRDFSPTISLILEEIRTQNKLYELKYKIRVINVKINFIRIVKLKNAWSLLRYIIFRKGIMLKKKKELIWIFIFYIIRI